MEGWQKKLNDILRLNNGFANAGAIPKDVHRMGEAAVDAYMEARANDKPSSAQWVYQQAILKQHAQWVEVLKRVQDLKDTERHMDWGRFVVLWQRYLACATMYVWSLARVRQREARRRGIGYYSRLLSSVRYVNAAVDPGELTAGDLSAAEKAKQERVIRRDRWAKMRQYRTWDGASGKSLVACHPYLMVGERDSRPKIYNDMSGEEDEDEGMSEYEEEEEEYEEEYEEDEDEYEGEWDEHEGDEDEEL